MVRLLLRARRWNVRLMAGTALLAFGVLATLAFWTSRTLGEAAAQVEHTLAVLAQVEAVLADAVDMQNGARGYVLTGDERFLAPARRGAGDWRGRVARLGELSREPDEEARVARLERRMRAQQLHLDRVVDLRRRRGFQAARALVAEGADHSLLEGVREAVDDLRDRAQLRLALQTASADAARGRATGAAAGAVAALSAAFVALLLWLRRDARERAALEAQLVVAGRMSSVGTLAAGLAHEINNPLAYVASNLGFVSDQLAMPWEEVSPELRAEVDQAVADAREGVDRIRVIVRDLRTFARGREEEPEPVDVRRAMRAAATMVRHALRGRARLELELSEVPLVRASEARLCQVFVNLLANAADATPAGSPDAHPIRLWVRARDGDVIAEVRDCGAGIAPDVLPHVFEPFFTTKGASGGSGLGLSVCHGIVTALGGRLEVESAPGRGSVFRVRLPAIGSARRGEAPAAERREQPEGEGCPAPGVAAASASPAAGPTAAPTRH